MKPSVSENTWGQHNHLLLGTQDNSVLTRDDNFELNYAIKSYNESTILHQITLSNFLDSFKRASLRLFFLKLHLCLVALILVMTMTSHCSPY